MFVYGENGGFFDKKKFEFGVISKGKNRVMSGSMLNDWREIGTGIKVDIIENRCNDCI